MELIFSIRLAFAEARYRLCMQIWDAAHDICELSLRVMKSAAAARVRAHDVRMAVMLERIEHLKRGA